MKRSKTFLILAALMIAVSSSAYAGGLIELITGGGNANSGSSGSSSSSGSQQTQTQTAPEQSGGSAAPAPAQSGGNTGGGSWPPANIRAKYDIGGLNQPPNTTVQIYNEMNMSVILQLNIYFNANDNTYSYLNNWFTSNGWSSRQTVNADGVTIYHWTKGEAVQNAMFTYNPSDLDTLAVNYYQTQ